MDRRAPIVVILSGGTMFSIVTQRRIMKRNTKRCQWRRFCLAQDDPSAKSRPQDDKLYCWPQDDKLCGWRAALLPIYPQTARHNPSPCLLTGEGVGSLSVTEGNVAIRKEAKLKVSGLKVNELNENQLRERLKR